MAIARDATSAGDSSGANSTTFAHTNTGSNLALFVGVMCEDGDNVTGVTYNGVAMTQLLKRTNTRTYYIYGLKAPATGANNVVISRSTTTGALVGISVSYTGVHQTLSLNHSTASADISAASSFALNTTTTVANAWALAFFRADNANNNITAGTGEYLVNTYGDTTYKRQGLIDTNGAITPAGTEELNASFPAGSNGSVVAVSFLPAGLDTGLISYYKLDESSGNAIDSVGDNDLTNNNTVGYAAAKINNGADFGTANTNKNFTISSALGTTGGAKSISLWVKLRTEISSGSYFLFNLREATNSTKTVIFYDYNSGTRQLIFRREKDNVGADSLTYTITLGTDNWYHLVYTYDTTNIIGYINGVAVGSPTAASGNGTGGANEFKLGSDTSGSFTSAYMDEVGIWSRALTADEVSQLYNSNRALAYPLTAPTLYGGVAYYKLDESSGNADDAIGARDLTNNGTTTYAAGKINNGAVFNGTSQYFNLTAGTLGIANAWTIAGWFNSDALTAQDKIFSCRPASGDANEIRLQIDDTDATKLAIVAMHSSGSGTGYKVYRGDTELSNSTWYFGAATWDGTNLKLYVNGEEETTTKTVDGTLVMTDTSRPLGIGSLSISASNLWDGMLDEIGYWSRALSSAEISELYNSGVGKQYPWSATTANTTNFFALF